MGLLEKKIEKLKNTFSDLNYTLTQSDLADLKERLLGKPVQLYLIAINWLKTQRKAINYESVVGLIKDDIKIRDKVREIITALEEGIWTKCLIDKNDPKFEIINSKKFKNLYKKNKLSEIIDKSANKSDRNFLKKIKSTRNKVSHLSYPILFQDFHKILQDLEQIKKLEFVNNSKIIKLVEYIKKVQTKWI